jgi:hypothetical protein
MHFSEHSPIIQWYMTVFEGKDIVENNGKGMVAHVHNPSYLGWRMEGSQFETSLGKKLVRTYLNKKVCGDMHLSSQLRGRYE